MSAQVTSGRIDWVDYAKGICIVMVVMMHSTLGVEAAADAQSWMHALVEFAKPFRMPDFFLISGLFLARVIDRDWRRYLDRKVVHFLYFYVLWVTIQFAFKAPGLAGELGAAGLAKFYLLSYLEPFGTLWFIYLLPVFFVVTKLTRRVPPVLIFLVGAALEAAPIETGWIMIDEFAARFVYFFAGYWLAANFFWLARLVQQHAVLALGAIAGWALINGVLVFGGYASLPTLSLASWFRGSFSRRRGGGATVARERARSAAVRRRTLDRHLSRVLPANGCHAYRSAEDGDRRGSRHGGADRDCDGCRGSFGPALVRARDAARLPVQASRLLPHRSSTPAGPAARGISHSRGGNSGL